MAFSLVLAGPVPAATADEVVYRFEAHRQVVQIDPPGTSMTAKAARFETVTGTFGYSSDARPTAQAGIPDRVAFASYPTGFIKLDEVDLGALPGDVELEVADGVARAKDPDPPIRDSLTISTRTVSTSEPVDAVSLKIEYKDANTLQGVAIPSSLDLGDLKSISLSFSTRVDALGDRSSGSTARPRILGLVRFEVTKLERVQ